VVHVAFAKLAVGKSQLAHAMPACTLMQCERAAHCSQPSLETRRTKGGQTTTRAS